MWSQTALFTGITRLLSSRRWLSLPDDSWSDKNTLQLYVHWHIVQQRQSYGISICLLLLFLTIHFFDFWAYESNALGALAQPKQSYFLTWIQIYCSAVYARA